MDELEDRKNILIFSSFSNLLLLATSSETASLNQIEDHEADSDLCFFNYLFV